MTELWGPTTAHLERYLDLLAARQRVTASNIANADTPGYRAREIDFHSEMQSLVGGAIPVRESLAEGAKNDGNNVNMDHELQVLADNVLRFNIASLLLQREIRGVRSAIREGR